jgi:hypothetical protein
VFPWRKRAFPLFIVAACCILALTLVILSPLALRGLASFERADWTVLGNIGQTYGAVSALLAGLALVGVAFSVGLQVRESRANRLEAGRTRHFELSKIALEDPLFTQVEPVPDDLDVNTRRLIIYINLQLQFWKMLWDFGELSEVELRRSIAPRLFATPIGQYYWLKFGLRREGLLAATRSDHRFEGIMNEVYRESVKDKSEVIGKRRSLASKHLISRHGAMQGLIRAGFFATAGLVFGVILGRTQRRLDD